MNNRSRCDAVSARERLREIERRGNESRERWSEADKAYCIGLVYGAIMTALLFWSGLA